LIETTSSSTPKDLVSSDLVAGSIFSSALASTLVSALASTFS